MTAYYAPSTAWLVKTDANGNMQWNLTVQGTVTIGNVTVNTAWVYGNNVIETKDGGFAIACTYDSSGEFIMTYFYLVKTEPALLPPTPTPTLTPVTNLNSNTLLVVIGGVSCSRYCRFSACSDVQKEIKNRRRKWACVKDSGI